MLSVSKIHQKYLFGKFINALTENIYLYSSTQVDLRWEYLRGSPDKQVHQEQRHLVLKLARHQAPLVVAVTGQ